MNQSIAKRNPYRILPAFFCILLSINFPGHTQEVPELLNKKLVPEMTSGSLGDFIETLQAEQGIMFSYDPSAIEAQRQVSVESREMTLKDLFESLFTENDIRYRVFENMVILTPFRKYTISGFVEDIESGEKLIGANITLSGGGSEQGSRLGTISNAYGFFSLRVREGTQRITVSFVGYNTGRFDIILKGDTTVLFQIEPGLEIGEVVITSGLEREELKKSSISMNTISVKSIENLPTLLGEGDVLKTMEYLPGVQFGSEASSGIIVRGGSPEQNLILLDGVPIYNSNHAFGLFSVFNSDAIKSLSLIKGGFPARYGGRLSSVIDVRMKEGNTREYHGDVNIGTIASKFTFEGPLIRNRSSFLLSARRTYIDLLMPKRMKDDEDIPGFYFYDVNAKINTRLGEKDRVFFSFYTGHDRFFEEERFSDEERDYYNNEDKSANWGNQTLLARWNHVYSKNLFSNLSLHYSRYGLTIDLFEEDGWNNGYNNSAIRYKSGIEDVSAMFNFDYYPVPDHDIKFGGSYIRHKFNPGTFSKKTQEYLIVDGEKSYTPSGNINESSSNDPVFASEFRAFMEDDITLGERWFTNAGLHFSGFLVDGNNYFSLEPRLSTSYSLTDRLALKAAYSRMKQYLHLMTHSGMGLPTDLWLPVTGKVKPQYSNQLTLGSVFYLSDQWKFNLESYYKTMHQIYAYKEGADYLSANNSWEDNIEVGRGSSYGIETMASKTSGKLTGWVAYTWSKTMRQFEEINKGEAFPYKYDRTHQVNIVSRYSFTDRFSVSATWLYATGMAYTLTTEKYIPLFGLYSWNSPEGTTGRYIDAIESRNNARMPDYHRMDLSMSYRWEMEKITGILNLSLYNVYNRFNPYLIYWDDDVSDNDIRKQKQLALFSVIPSLSFRIIF